MTRMSSASLSSDVCSSDLCVFWIRNTINAVTIVVVVLMPSCQVLLNSKNGPLAAQISTTATAAKKVIGFPAIRAISEANVPNISCTERASRASNTCALSPGSAFLPFTCTLDFAFFIMFILPQLTSYAGGSYFEKRLWGDELREIKQH